MARLAIFIDGGYIDAVTRDHYAGTRIDYSQFSDAIAEVVRSSASEPVDLLRTIFYTCLPYQGTPPTEEESRRVSGARRFIDTLRRLPRYDVRLGRLVKRGTNGTGQPIFVQKGVDLQLGVDFALLSAKQSITHAVLVSGDSDLLPALRVAKQEGVSVWLVHGPQGTYANELWNEADDRHELTQEFIDQVTR